MRCDRPASSICTRAAVERPDRTRASEPLSLGMYRRQPVLRAPTRRHVALPSLAIPWSSLSNRSHCYPPSREKERVPEREKMSSRDDTSGKLLTHSSGMHGKCYQVLTTTIHTVNSLYYRFNAFEHILDLFNTTSKRKLIAWHRLRKS